MERKNERLPIFTERFRELQGDRSNTEFADFLGISRQTVGFYYNGDRVPDAITLTKISQKCGVSADWLLGLSEYKDSENERVCAKDLGLSEKSIEVLKCLLEYKMSGLIYVLNYLIEQEAYIIPAKDGSNTACYQLSPIIQGIYDFLTVVGTAGSETLRVGDNDILNATKDLQWIESDASVTVERGGPYDYHGMVRDISKEEVIEHVLLSRIEKNLKELKKAFYKNRPRR